ncbi:histone-lysine N-methyltransferase [Venturia nashicola]|uniref:Histone-lysine N-methyltransferase n=1 Tax=Venturia nashicola TaxID=86259 RepID=A0A4Z1P1M9_9PEZI|nr:histone-lysine N-methyltransferase [Venturia nashicola]
MVDIPSRRFGQAYVHEEEIIGVVCLRIKDNAEEYLVHWKSKAPPNRTPYSWHKLHELAGVDGSDFGNTSTGSCLKHVQRYIEELRSRPERQHQPQPHSLSRSLSRDSSSSRKRKRPEGGRLHNIRQLSPFDRLSEKSRSPSVFSARSDNSSRTSTEEDESDTYNCTLEVKGGVIKMKLSSLQPYNTTIFPSKVLSDRAFKLRKNTKAADEKIRNEFVRGLEKIRGQKPVNLVNTRDMSTPLLSFKFVNDYEYGCGIEPPVPEAMEGCQSCRPNMGGFCGCEYTKRCECLEFARVDEHKLDDQQKKQYARAQLRQDTTMGLPKRFPYSKETGHLVTFYLESEFAIFECNDNCGCANVQLGELGHACKTRVVQNGRQVGLEIFRTTNRGWGLRCTEALAAGQFVDTYLGEVITGEEADKRSNNAAKGKDSYLFTLDKFKDDLNEDPYEIDGEFVGGPSRFINHSCDPNCAVYAVCKDKNNLYQYDLAFFALRPIKPGEELTFDYLASSGELDEEPPSNSQKDPPIPCLCNSKNCRKILWK